jgi:integrase/recombinase XerD
MSRPRTALLFPEWPKLDQDLWQAANSTGKFLEPDGKAAHWKDKTRKGVVKRYSLWLGYLLTTDQLNLEKPPSVRTSKKALTGYVHWLEAKGNASTTVSSCVRDLEEAIRVMEPHADRSLIKELNVTLRAREEPVRAKHARIMHPDDLLSGALSFLDDISNLKFRGDTLRAGKYRDGLVIAFLPYRPVRLENLTTIALGRHLIRGGDGWFCQFGADEMKDNQSLSFTFPDRLVPYLQTYLNIYRPILLKGNDFPELWISTRRTPMSEQAVYWNTCRLTEELFGQRINPHLFRDCAASAMATDDPEHVLAIARILGHSSIETSTRHYNQSQMTAAGDILHEVLADLHNVPDTGDPRSEV